MPSGIGPVIDWLVTQMPSRLTVIAADALVVDGQNYGDTSDTMLYVGRENPDNTLNAAEAARAIVVFGSRRADEDPIVPCFMDVYRDGTAQKAARDPALACFEAVATLLKQDPTCGGAINYGAAQIRGMHLLQPATDKNGRVRAIVPFNVEFHHVYNPS